MITAFAVGVALAAKSVFAGGDQRHGFAFGGNGPGAAQRLQLSVDSGRATSFDLTSDDPARLAIARVAGSPGLFTLTPLAQTARPVVLIATAREGRRDASATVDVSLDAVLFVGNRFPNSIAAYAPWSAAPLFTIAPDFAVSPVAMTFDAAGNLFVANYDGNSVCEFAPGDVTPARTFSGLDEPLAIAVDRDGNLFVTNYGNGTVEEFATKSAAGEPSRVLSHRTGGIATPGGLAVDSGGNLYVANWDAGVSIFAPGPSTAPAASLSAGTHQPGSLAFDASGSLYVLNHANVTVYRWPLTGNSAPVRAFPFESTNDANGIAVDPSGNVYVADDYAGKVAEFAPDGSLIRTIPGSKATSAIAVDENGFLFVANKSLVNVYAPGPSTQPAATIADGIATAASMAVWP